MFYFFDFWHQKKITILTKDINELDYYNSSDVENYLPA